MKNLRKLIAVVLLVALVFSSMTTIFAADALPALPTLNAPPGLTAPPPPALPTLSASTVANVDKAATLKDLGLYYGTDATDVAAGLDCALTTQDSLIFLARLFGYNEAANALTADQVAESLAKFDDAASISEYAKNVVAYSATNSILSGSTKDDKFFVGAKDTVTAARFATFMLKQMGYTVADYKESVAKLAETKGSKVDATITGDLTRDAAVGMMYATLTSEKVSGKTVIADIVGDNADLKTKAEKAGLIAIKESDDSRDRNFGIVSVKVLNNKQLEIEFSSKMNKNSAENQANYKVIDRGDVEKTLTNNSCELGDDMKTVTITFDNTVEDCLTNASNAKVIVSKNIEDESRRSLGSDKEMEVEVQDGLLPTVKEVKAIGEENIRITFSEPVCEANNNSKILNSINFHVKSGTYTYYVENANLNLDVIDLEVGTKLIEGPITVTVNAAGLDGNVIQDYAGYKVFKGEHKFDYLKDTSAPVVTVKSADKNEVVLNFSKLVKGSNIKLYHTEKDIEANKAEVTTTDGYVDTITFKFDEYLPIGILNLYLVNSENNGERIIDSYGISVEDKYLTCEVFKDTTAPVVTYCEFTDDKTILIVFDEELDVNVAINPDSYEVKRLSDNKIITLDEVIYDNDNQSVMLQFPVAENTEYLVSIKSCQDINGNMNKSDYIIGLTNPDYENPEVMVEDCYAIAEEDKLFILYSETMNEAQMLDKSNYMVSIDGGNVYKNLDTEDRIFKVNDREIQIYFMVTENSNTPTISYYVKIAPIMDLAGNRLYGSRDSWTFGAIESKNVIIEKAELIGTKKIKIVFDEKMDNFEASDIALTNLTTPSSINVSSFDIITENSDGKTEVVLNLGNDLPTDAKNEAGDDICITTIDNPLSKSVRGFKLSSQFSKPLVDKIVPEIVKWDHDNDVLTVDVAKVIASENNITIFFSEDIKDLDLKETFEVEGFTISNITAPVGAKTVILTVTANEDNTHNIIDVKQVKEIHDIAGNSFISGSSWEATRQFPTN